MVLVVCIPTCSHDHACRPIRAVMVMVVDLLAVMVIVIDLLAVMIMVVDLLTGMVMVVYLFLQS
jgi:hypothetical protein